MKHRWTELFRATLYWCCLATAVTYGDEQEWMQQFNDDLNFGNDIFTEFGEELESKRIQEEERFYRYGRFVSFTMGLGVTTFTGNRGKAYHDQNPTFSFGFIYFSDFQNAITLGIDYSKHVMYVDTPVQENNDPEDFYGAIDISLLRPHVGYRYYVDTSQLGSILTYANPYFSGRLEYWYQTNRFREYDDSTQKGGGIGLGIGLGIEIPTDLEKSFIGLQFLVHQVNFFDKETRAYKKEAPDETLYPGYCQTNVCYGYDDLKGTGYSLITSYLMSW